MNIEQMFCWVMADLDACILSTWHYHQMRIAGLVRLLTFDEQPLVHQVNRTHRLQLRFSYYDNVSTSVGDQCTVDALRFSVASLDPRPLLYAGGTAASVPLDQWLRVGVLRLQDRELTVLEFTQQMAYIEGLVHAGRPRDDFEQYFVAMRTAERRLDNFSLIGFDLLKQIGRITHSGLLPLRDAVEAANLLRDGRYPKFHYG